MQVPSLLLERWRTGDLTGDQAHAGVVRVRRIHFEHGYFDENRIDTGAPIFPPLIWKGNNHHCWKGRMVADGPWITLPNIQSVKWTKSFQDQSATTATVEMDNIAYQDTTGVRGLFRKIVRGFFSPTRGIAFLSRPQFWESTGWDNILNSGYEIEIWEGYGRGADVAPGGPSISKTFVGVIENCDLSSFPDHITLTARDFSVLLTDQRCMGWNKAAELRAPITFADRRGTMGEEIVIGSYEVSDGAVSVDPKKGALWISDGEGSATPSPPPYIEVTLPGGHYEEFLLTPGMPGQTVYVALNVATPADMYPAQTLPAGWVDLGLGTVPGTTVPYIRVLNDLSGDVRKWNFGGSQQGYDFNDGTKLRLYFTNLTPVGGGYRASVDSFYAFRYGTNPSQAPGAQVNAKHWILVEDAAQVIRMVLIWAGFQEWHVEDFGWSLARPLQFGEDKFFMDIINELLKQGNFVFYMGSPSNHDMTLGVPTFEPQKATARPPTDTVDIRDTDMTEAFEPIWDTSNLPYVIRYRGDVTKHGVTLDQDLVKRYMATYYPPWSNEYSNLTGRGFTTHRVAGIRRHYSQTIGAIPGFSLESNEECLFACLLAAVQFCLQLCTGKLQIAGLPAFELNGQVNVVEESTGMNSRLWVGSVESEHTFAEKGMWKMTVGGSMIDLQDMYLIAADFQVAYRQMRPFRPPSGEGAGSSPPDPGVEDISVLMEAVP